MIYLSIGLCGFIAMALIMFVANPDRRAALLLLTIAALPAVWEATHGGRLVYATNRHIYRLGSGRYLDVLDPHPEAILSGVERLQVEPARYSPLFNRYLDRTTLAIYHEDDPAIRRGLHGGTCSAFSHPGLNEPPYLIVAMQLEDWTRDQALASLRDCLPHEIGHLIDAETKESDTTAFRAAVQDSLMLEDDPAAPWFEVQMIIREFPGINGNEKVGAIGEWGDYHELYAELFRYPLTRLPPPLVSIYRAYNPID